MSENQIFLELIRYYQQLKSLLASVDWPSEEGRANTKSFYKENIERLRKQCHEANPKRLAELDANRANDCTVTEAEYIS